MNWFGLKLSLLLGCVLMLGGCAGVPVAQAAGDGLVEPTPEVPPSVQEPEVRQGVIRRGDEPLSLVGAEVKVGDEAPSAPLRGNAMEKVELNFADGRTRVLTFVPSLDTPTCSVQTRRFNAGASRLAEDVEVLVISRDLPYAQARFCGANGLERVITYSDFVAGEFGKAWGFYVQETDLLARAVVVVDKDGVVRYLQVVEDLAEQPDYDDAMEALKVVVPASVRDAEESREAVEAPVEEGSP